MEVTDKNARGKYLSKNALKTWQEDFIDEDTGEVVSIERNEVVVRRGALLDDLTISLLSENGITDIEVSEVKRLGSWDNSKRRYEVVARVPRQFHGKTKKVKEMYLTHEYSAAEAEARVVDELEKSCEGEFKIFKVAVSNIDRIILSDGVLMCMDLITRIRQVIYDKRSHNIIPAHALFYGDLLTAGQDREQLKQELRELARAGKIHIGCTINDYYITLKS